MRMVTARIDPFIFKGFPFQQHSYIITCNLQGRPYHNQHETLSKTNLYIRGLTPTTTDQDLINLCHKYGQITSTKAIVDQATNKCKGE